MVKDPLYRKILDRLDEGVDPGQFETCMTDILRDALPGLVPVPGGKDGGYDGSVADGEGEPFPLVCTTSERVERNLAESLDSFARQEIPTRKVALATSQRLSPGRRLKLQALAREKGFIPVQIFERRYVAARLYRHSRWRQELLGIPGTPSPLSVIPASRRPLMDLKPVGRDADLQWLREGRQDRVLTGEPGSGKTFLLHHLMTRGWPGLFLTSDDEAAVADALRDQQPRVVVVDDAHVALHRIDSLRRLRQETGARFDIVATTWNGARDLVIDRLVDLPDHRVRKLELLTRDEVVEVFRAAGVDVREDVFRKLVDQASNKPGLAVTIAGLCLQGAWPEILTGKVLGRTLLVTFRELVGKDAAAILAAFSLGGEAGMDLKSTGECLGLGLAEIGRKASALSAGGVLFERGKDRLAVRPRILRSALLRDVFFPDSGPGLPYRVLLDRAPHRQRAVETIVQARLDGVRVPDTDLRELVAAVPSRDAWAGLAASGTENAQWVLASYPYELTDIASEALHQAPESVLPVLLDRAADAPGTPQGRTRHPLRILADWAKELDEYRPSETMRRRRLVAQHARRYLQAGGDLAVGVQAICALLSPTCEGSHLDPGAGRTLTMRWAVLSREQLREVTSLWDSVREAIPRLDREAWRHLSSALWGWVYPTYSFKSIDVPDETRELMPGFAVSVLRDVAPLAKGRPGLTKAIQDLAARAGTELDLDEDPIYGILFPPDYEGDDFESWQAGQLGAVRELATRWSGRDPVEVIEEIRRYEHEAREAGRTWPRRTPDLCRELAHTTVEPAAWASLLIEAGAEADLVLPFLEEAARARLPGWVSLIERCLSSERYDWLGLNVALRAADTPENVLTRAMEKAPGAAQLVETLCLRQEIPSARVAALLNHPDRKTALAAAVGEWLADPEGEVRPELLPMWRSAILRSGHEDDLEGPGLGFWLGVILNKSPDLAEDWLRRMLRSMRRSFRLAPDDIAEKALSGLGKSARAALLREIKGDLIPAGFVPSLIGRDPELYRELLASPEARSYHLAPLGGSPDEAWLPLALAALDRGYLPVQIAHATIWENSGAPYSGTMKDHWREIDSAFSRFEDHSKAEVRAIAHEGRGIVRHETDGREKTLRTKAVHGY